MAIADYRNEDAVWSAAAKRVVGLCFLLNMVDGIDVVILSYIAPLLTADWTISATAFGTVFSAGLLGMAIGGLLVAPLADRLGRRVLILAGVGLMTVGMGASGLVRNMPELIILRIVVGTGIGTVLACMSALVAEHAPPVRRTVAVGVIQSGYPLAAAAAGFVMAWVLPLLGWRVSLSGAGLLSLVLLPFLWVWLPEAHDQHREMEPSLSQPRAVMTGGWGPKRIFAEGYGAISLRLWGATFCSLMVLYFVVSWVPKLAIQGGLDQEHALYAGALYNFGAFVGTVSLAALTIRFDARLLTVTAFVLASLALLAFGGLRLPLYGVLLTAFAVGATVQSGYNGLYPIAASIYPYHLRSTGLGSAMGIGRAGAVLGPLLGGYAMDLKLPLVAIFAIFVVPVLIAALCAAGLKHDTEAKP